MATTRRQLVALIERNVIADDQVDRAVQLSGLYPSGLAWRGFVDRLLLWLGGLALACSMLFFIAYNWADMGRFFRFGLVEGALVVAIAAYWKTAGRGMAAQVWLMVATLLLGVLLALFGQVYQTGADSWQLFFYWALLMTPWALIGRSAVLWIFWLTLINLAVLLYYQAWGGIFGALFGLDFSALWLLFLFNTGALALWELGAVRWTWLSISWPKRLLALGSGLPITLLALFAISDYRQLSGAALVVYPLWLSVLYVAYRKLVADLFMLAGGCLSAMAVIVYFLGEALFLYSEPGGLLVLALLILGLSAAAVVWLKRVHWELGS